MQQLVALCCTAVKAEERDPCKGASAALEEKNLERSTAAFWGLLVAGICLCLSLAGARCQIMLGSCAAVESMMRRDWSRTRYIRPSTSHTAPKESKRCMLHALVTRSAALLLRWVATTVRADCACKRLGHAETETPIKYHDIDPAGIFMQLATAAQRRSL